MTESILFCSRKGCGQPAAFLCFWTAGEKKPACAVCADAFFSLAKKTRTRVLITPILSVKVNR